MRLGRSLLYRSGTARLAATAFALAAWLCAGVGAAFELTVVDSAGNPVSGFRWQLEEDNTEWVVPGAQVSDSIAVNIHKSHAPLVANGESAGATASIVPPDPGLHYYLSVLPADAATMTGHSIGGAPVAPGQTAVRVVVNDLPLPTAQVAIWVFEDNNIMNNAPDRPNEAGLANFKVILEDMGGQMLQDAFGNPIGTEYLRNPDGSFQLDVDGLPIADPAHIGDGVLVSDADGWAYAKYLAPGKYAVVVTPPVTGPGGVPVSWVQTATIEGTNVIDAFVMADEPPLFVEGFGTGTAHVEFGFVNPDTLPWVVSPPAGGTEAITGRIVNNHFNRPPQTQGYHAGEPVPDCWVGLNDPASQQGLIAVECKPDSTFDIFGVPPGTYQFVYWDVPLNQLFGFQDIVVEPGVGTLDLGDVLSFRWFGTLQGRVFNDLDQDGFPDPGEPGIADQAVNLRFRDGRVYQSTISQPPDGSYILSEVFPFFKWLVAEVDFATRKATGATMAVDGGGAVPLDDGWTVPSRGKLRPQEQAATNPHTGNNLSRTESGEVLLEAMQLYLGQTNVIDWGKAAYSGVENGGITGIVFYTTTRAENDPRMAAGEPWEPGIPRVQVNLYQDWTGPGGLPDGLIDDLDGDGVETLADVDNFPFGFFDGLPPGDEDVDRDLDGFFDPGDAINIVWTDSWDDAPPTGCIQELPVIHGVEVPECYDNFGTWNQIRPGVFDGGYAITSYFPGGMVSGSLEVGPLPTGTYIVEAAAPLGYEHQKEEDRNVDFGDTYTPSGQSAAAKGGEPEALPAECVGNLHVVPDYLSLFPGLMEPAPFAGQSRPLCDRKLVPLTAGLNAAAEFFMWTAVPKASRVVGFVNNDLTAEFNINTPNFGEKAAPSWLPISIQDYAGNVVNHVYTDEFGAYNALVPSTYSVNIPAPSGVSPGMVTFCLNYPFMPDPSNPGQMIPDPYYDPDYGQACWVREMVPGGTTYNDTPIVPIGAFVGYPNRNVDVEPADLTPGIATVDGDLVNGGPAACAPDAQLTITSIGLRDVPNPDFEPGVPGSQPVITRDYRFGATQGRVTLGGLDLPIVSWSSSVIVATVPGGYLTGQLLVQRGDNQAWSESGLTVHVGVCSATYVPTDVATIQAAIDAAAPGDLIIVKPGLYNENPILWKPLSLQGSGSSSTIIFANATAPQDRLPAWHDKVLTLLGNDPFMANEAPGIIVVGNAGVPFGGIDALIDGFQVTGSISGGGVCVGFDTIDLTVSNNVIRSNQGSYGGGVTIGMPDVPTTNSNVALRYNRIVKNGGLVGAGGVSVFPGSTGYEITDSFIAGNLSRWYGGGIAHWGLSDNGLIARNDVLFNEVFYGAAVGGDGGGIFIGGQEAGLGVGSGSVTIDANRIQGNLAGSGYGGGIRVLRANGTDVATLPPAQWNEIGIFNNILANNVAAMAGGAIALQDAARVAIINNTIVNNDATATSASAFAGGVTNPSTPQIAGLASGVHSVGLQAIFPTGLEQEFSDPILENNILWHNRSYYWDPAYNANKGGLRPASPLYRDFGVLSTNPAHILSPYSSVLTDPTGYDPSNVTGDPVFASEAVNSLVGAAVLDEGGNSISVRFTPLTNAASDYLIDPMLFASSSAYGIGDGSWVGVYPALAFDIQGDPRGLTGVEAGADEAFLAAGDANCDGVVDTQDLLQIIEVIFGGPSVCLNEDVNGDGMVNAADLAWTIASVG
jgi:hypothetical protein